MIAGATDLSMLIEGLATPQRVVGVMSSPRPSRMAPEKAKVSNTTGSSRSVIATSRSLPTNA